VLQSIDPGRPIQNGIPPPVHMEKVIADRREFGAAAPIELPALTRDVEIDYTALSFSVPQKVSFRYQLEGRDAGWQEAGTRRQAFYSSLRPGRYRFHVIASNNDGVWNEEGASIGFAIAPAWYQTTVFRISCLLAGLLLLWLIYYLRMKQASRSIRARFDERIAERTRLARDLHDTLLQTLQGSKLVADDALEHRSDVEYTSRSLEKLSEWIDQAMREGRAALNTLHSSAFDNRELSKRLQSALEELEPNSVAERIVNISGTPVEMDPLITDEICRLGYEAIRNAFMHSHAARIEVQLTYSKDFTLIVRDNGRGMDSTMASRGSDGHFGLQSMRERAARIHGQFQLITGPNLGTTIELKIEGKTAFGQGAGVWWKLLSWLGGARRSEV
jgi:signal transduction histidine kinase